MSLHVLACPSASFLACLRPSERVLALSQHEVRQLIAKSGDRMRKENKVRLRLSTV
jgi:hypothetical protein